MAGPVMRSGSVQVSGGKQGAPASGSWQGCQDGGSELVHQLPAVFGFLFIGGVPIERGLIGHAAQSIQIPAQSGRRGPWGVGQKRLGNQSRLLATGAVQGQTGLPTQVADLSPAGADTCLCVTRRPCPSAQRGLDGQ